MMKHNEAIKWRTLIENAAKYLPDIEAIDSLDLFPIWTSEKTYTIGDRVRYKSLLYKCILNHTSQSTWTPDSAVSLWSIVANPDEWPEWIQPTGAHNSYSKGDKVSHNDSHWISNVDNNVWEPGTFGWDLAQ